MADGSGSATATVYVAPISGNVSVEHLREIMGNFGAVVGVEFEALGEGPEQCRAARIAFESAGAVDVAVKHMDKGEIDGVRVRLSLGRPNPSDLPKLVL